MRFRLGIQLAPPGRDWRSGEVTGAVFWGFSFRLERYSQARSQRPASVSLCSLQEALICPDTWIRHLAALTGAARKGTLMTADLAIFPSATARRSLSAQARHLHPAALPRWRALLEARWQEQLRLVTELSLACHDARQAACDPGSGPDARQAARRGAATGRLALAEIEAALARLATGRFGWCQRCGTAITAARLTEIPQARCCPACER